MNASMSIGHFNGKLGIFEKSILSESAINLLEVPVCENP